MERENLAREIVKIIDLYVDAQEKEAIFLTFPTELNRLRYVGAFEKFDRGTKKLAPWIDHGSVEFQEILSLGTDFLNRVRNFALGNKV